MSSVLLMLVVFLALATIKVPIAFSLGVAGCIGIFALKLAWASVPQLSFYAINSFPLLAIPFFMLAGDLMKEGGISRKLIEFIQLFTERARGAMGAVLIIGSALFGTITGSSVATVSSIGSIMGPEMLKQGYSKPYVTALAAASGYLGILIPPSIPGILYAMTTGTSVGAVWLSTIGPGILIITGYIILNRFLSPHIEKQNGNSHATLSLPAKAKVMINAIPALIMPLLILGGVYGGIFTPTEASVVAVVYGGIVGWVIYKNLTLRDTLQMLGNTGRSSATVMVMVAFAGFIGRIVTIYRVPQTLAIQMQTVTTSPITMMMLVNIVLLFLGMFLETNTIVLMAAPVFATIAQQYGINPIHFASVFLLNVSVGMITPPYAANLFVACKLTGTPMGNALRPLVPYFLLSLTVLILVTYVPGFSLWLPNLLLRH